MNKGFKEFLPSSWAIDHSTVVYVLISIFFILGFSSYLSLPRENFPEINSNVIFVSSVYPGNTAEDVERLITDPLEEELKGVSNLVGIKSTSQENISLITIEFDENILKNYMLKLNDLHITDKAYFIIGLGVIKSAKSARWMNKNLFGINIPEEIINRIEQSNDERKFNRGKLLNIGFDYALKRSMKHPPKHDIFIFHDVDLLPQQDVSDWYAKFPTKPTHIARVWDRYSNNNKYFGGIVSFSEADMKRINGYPNTFWGWGGEDDEMQKRLETCGIEWVGPTTGTIQDLEEMDLSTKLGFLKQNSEWKCMVKWEALEEHPKTWQTNGLADLNYDILNIERLDKDDDDAGAGGEGSSKVTKLTTDVKLNGSHWSNQRCGVDYLPP